jgi:hypothetical protein
VISPVEGSQLFCTVEAPPKGIGTVPTALVSGAGMSVVFFWMMMMESCVFDSSPGNFFFEPAKISEAKRRHHSQRPFGHKKDILPTTVRHTKDIINTTTVRHTKDILTTTVRHTKDIIVNTTTVRT